MQDILLGTQISVNLPATRTGLSRVVGSALRHPFLGDGRRGGQELCRVGHWWFREGCVILAIGANLTRALRGGDEQSRETTPADNAFPATPACCRERGAACEGAVPTAPSARVAACSGAPCGLYLRGSLIAGRVSVLNGECI